MFIVTKEFTFDAAHYLTKYHGKCENLHGHTYKLQVSVCGELNDEDMVLDFIVLKNIVKDKVLNKFDHSNLNDFFEQPSAEIIAKWIWDETKEDLSKENYKLHKVRVWETPTSFATYFEEL